MSFVSCCYKLGVWKKWIFFSVFILFMKNMMLCIHQVWKKKNGKEIFTNLFFSVKIESIYHQVHLKMMCDYWWWSKILHKLFWKIFDKSNWMMIHQNLFLKRNPFLFSYWILFIYWWESKQMLLHIIVSCHDKLWWWWWTDFFHSNQNEYFSHFEYFHYFFVG